MKLLTTLFAMLFFSAVATKAQMPVLKINHANAQQAVSLQKLNIDVQIVGNIATTTMTMTFFNNSASVLEGELTFPMPDGVTVSRYALDMNGKMREAVPVEKAKATEVFESIERQRVDPGLLEKVEGNNFRTRIYPMPAKGARTILVAYEEELKLGQNNALRYHLPLAYTNAIADFTLTTTIYESTVKPELVAQPDGSFSLNNNGNTYVATLNKKNFKPNKTLTINLPKLNSLPEVQLQKAGSAYYFLINVYPKQESRPRVWANEIGVIWDCSLSGLQRDTAKELALLDLIIKQKQNLTIRLGLLNNSFKNGGTFVIANGNWKQLKEKLQAIVYDGGTNFSAINSKILPAANYLFFTDGLSTFGTNNVALKQPVHTINTAQKADYSTLKYISLKTGGQFVNLVNIDTKEGFKLLNEEHLQYLGIKNAADVKQSYPSLPVNVDGHLAVAGISGQFSTNVILQFGFGNTVTSTQTVQLNPMAPSLTSVDISRIWAQKKITEMDVQYEQNKADISRLSKQFGIVTRNTSLLVLENLSDYIRYEITPPKELLQAYEAALKQRNIAFVERRNNLITSAIMMANELKTWWNTDFSGYKAKKEEDKYPVPDALMGRVSGVQVDAPAAQAARTQAARNEAAQAQRNNQALNEVVIVGAAQAQQKRAFTSAASTTVIRPAAPAPVVKVVDYKSDKDYMKNLTGKGEEAYQQYLAVRTDYVSTPTFYFDVANWFYQQADTARATMILSNIADLDLENADLFKVMAYKLKQVGHFREALFVTQKVLQWRPMDAQSYRDYALALADVGQYQQALNNLYKVLMQTYNTQTTNRDRGIEEIIVPEINNLISLHRNKLKLDSIDQKLIQALPVDIRVVLNWNKNDTDIDLWLTDPNGEKCYYSHNRTGIGGRMSRDFTEGYGPEQFMLKKAIAGKYKIEVNYYGDRQLTISGPTTVTAEIYTSYATGKQKRQIIVMPLEASNKKGNFVGEFSFY